MRKLFFMLLLPASLLYGQSFDRVKMDSLFTLIEAHEKAMGSISISQGGKEVYQRSIGYSDIDRGTHNMAMTRFRIGSISKTFTAVILLQLVEEGRLSLDQPLSDFFADLPSAQAIRVEDLLLHRSGLVNFTNAADYLDWSVSAQSREELLKRFSANGMAFEPGSKAEYANTNYVLLTWIAEQVSGRSFSSLVQERIAARLGLLHTFLGETKPQMGEARSYDWVGTWSPSQITDLSIPLGAGAMISNPYELNRFYRGLLTGQLVSDSTLSLMTHIVDGYGMGLIRLPYNDKYAYGHTGGIDGYQAVAGYFPKQDLAIAWTGNAHAMAMNDILLGALKIWFGDEYTLPSFAPSLQLDPALLDKYVGQYTSAAFPLQITLTRREATLWAQATGQGAFPLEAVDERTFRFDAAGVVLTFEGEKEMILEQMGMRITFQRE
jgi:D-alanyl-D-alanine carboxypeptidase